RVQITQTHLCDMLIFITVYSKQRPSKSGDTPYLAKLYGRSRSSELKHSERFDLRRVQLKVSESVGE
ncbi:hypothetical protein P4534_22740, partial [Peribacillus butanolivorans]|uniref:hypothetical protein n=1 Tax=Peribacillus butanolivorans TaxID=421767 RepID=UPI002E24E07D|nr:hypothetical protein [Peribacillus butanolivorans]